MSRHIADRRHAHGDTRLKRFTDVERHDGADGSNPAARAAHERPATRSAETRLKQYVRIERGQTT